MTEKIKCILLVDDNDATNYIHEYIIDEANCAVNVRVVRNGQEALDFLKSTNASAYIRPDVIFLDINMPVMGGWEFLEHYAELEDALKSTMMVVMLTTSINPDDRLSSLTSGVIDRFISKPLTIEILQDLQLQFVTTGLENPL